MQDKHKELIKDIPDSPGVYLMRGLGKILYVGKAGNLKRRVSSYFMRPQEYRLERLIQEIDKIDFKKTDTAIEALILEAELIKKHKPPFNVREKDDKSFLYVVFTKEKFPRVLLMRGKEFKEGRETWPVPSLIGRLKNRSTQSVERSVRYSVGFGPFTSATSIREALRILRKIFPWHTHSEEQIKKSKRACFEYEIGLCPGTCIGAISKEDYSRNIKNLKLIFQGKKGKIIRSLEKDMKKASRELEFERAEEFKRQLFALRHIRDISLIKDETPVFKENKTRIEGYDISNISGTSSVGSMVVFENDYPSKDNYRKFKIRTLTGTNDTGMMKEVLRRRFKHWSDPAAKGGAGWSLPDIILIDGGVGQVNAAQEVLNEFGLSIPIVGLAKGPERKRNDVVGEIPDNTSLETLIKVRDEAHRFAISYHKNLRGRRFLGKD